MREKQTSVYGRASEFVWNLVGGSMVVAMLAGVVYVLAASIFSELHGVDSYWDSKYFIRYFVALLLFYLILPSAFSGMVGGLLGLTSNSSKKQNY